MIGLVVVVAILIVFEAIQLYISENNASKKVEGKRASFLLFMFQNHPFIISVPLFFIVAGIFCFAFDILDFILGFIIKWVYKLSKYDVNVWIIPVAILTAVLLALITNAIIKFTSSKRWIFLTVLVAVILSIGFCIYLVSNQDHKDYSELYIQAARSYTEEYGIQDATITIGENGSFEGRDVYLITVDSPAIDELSRRDAYNLTRKIENIYVNNPDLWEWENTLVNGAVYSNGNTYEIDYKGNLKKNGENYYTINTSDSSNSDVIYASNCIYPDCNRSTCEGSNYCVQHKCKVDGCASRGTSGSMFKYCSKHLASETCAVSGCNAVRYKAKNSKYCQMHYPDGK